jgi:hypothetical protein
MFLAARLAVVMMILLPLMRWGFPFWVTMQADRKMTITVLAILGAVLSAVGGVLQNDLKDNIVRLRDMADKLGEVRRKRIVNAADDGQKRSVGLVALNAASAILSAIMTSPPSAFTERVVVAMIMFSTLLGITSWVDAYLGRRRTLATLGAVEDLIRIESEHRTAIRDLRKEKLRHIDAARAVVGIYDYRSGAHERLARFEQE